MNIHQIAANLCERAEKLGLDNPTEDMISGCLLNVVCNTLNFPVETAQAIPGNEKSTVMAMYRLLLALTGPMAERVALDMDHNNRDHRGWYREVKRARRALDKMRAKQ